MNKSCIIAIIVTLVLVLPLPSSVKSEDRTRIRIVVFLNGDARWFLSEEIDLPTPEDRDAFDNYTKALELNKEALLSDFSAMVQNLVIRASNLTGREMTAVQFDMKTMVVGINCEVGVIEYSFLWTNFSRIDGRLMTLGDVFQGGFYMYENDTLVISYPQELRLIVASPPPDSNLTNEVVWRGRRDFGPGEPKMVLEDRRTSLILFLSRTELATDEELTISGQLSPPLGGEPITLTISGPSGAREISLITLQDGSFHLSLTLDEPGEWEFLVSYPGSGTYLGCKSELGRVYVREGFVRYLLRSPFVLAIIIFAVLLSSFWLVWSFRKRKRAIGAELLATDYEMVEAVLRKAGGAMLQSGIRSETGFSGAKLSRILKEMEQSGKIRRERKGREMVVFLLKRQ